MADLPTRPWMGVFPCVPHGYAWVCEWCGPAAVVWGARHYAAFDLLGHIAAHHSRRRAPSIGT